MAEQDYEVRIEGLVPTEGLLAELRDVRVAQHEFRTVLSGRFVDQADLYGFVNLLRSYGLEVVEVRRVPAAEGAGDQLEEEQQEDREEQEP